MRIFNPLAKLNKQLSLAATYHKHEEEKKRQYEQHVQEIEHSSFTPLVFTTPGGMGNCSTVFYKHLTMKLCEKKETPYNIVMSMIRCKLRFAPLRSSILCIPGTRSSLSRPLLNIPLDLKYAEGQMSCI